MKAGGIQLSLTKAMVSNAQT
ncbi:hypothetical protein IEO21_05647 [Rhodonia placenta]|uniref:Uncharacterized protein n=1 Tax=Rhodonia placenta TaxID=104341 RepID=A0A8H7P1H7_9APHY|nr:hypothetical protein IEO21_05647 [Postia placenta]